MAHNSEEEQKRFLESKNKESLEYRISLLEEKVEKLEKNLDILRNNEVRNILNKYKI